MTRFASTTSVPIDRSQGEIQRTLQRYGANEFMFGNGDGFFCVAFRFKERAIKIKIDAPAKYSKPRWTGDTSKIENPRFDQELRQRFRCVLLVIKAKLEAVESGIVTVEQEFMPYLVMPDGRTVSEHSMPAILGAYASGKMPKSIFGDNGQRMLTDEQ